MYIYYIFLHILSYKVYEVYFYSLLSFQGLIAITENNLKRPCLLGDVQNIIIVSKRKFRFLDSRQVEHMEGTQLTLSIQYLGTQTLFQVWRYELEF